MQPNQQQDERSGSAPEPVYWRVEGSLLDLSAVRPLIFITRNTQSFLERWARRWGLAVLVLLRPLLYALHRRFATRVLHTLLRGVSADRLDLLGEEYFRYQQQPRLKPRGVAKLKEAMASGRPVVLVSQGLEQVMRPLAEHLGAAGLIANRLEFRDGLATGRLLDPVIRPRGGLARILGGNPDGSVSLEKLERDLGQPAEELRAAVRPARRVQPKRERPVVMFDGRQQLPRLSVRQSLAGKHILLIGVTGFIGKVWLVNALRELPEVGRIYLLIRRQKSNSALRRFEKMVEESPLFDPLHQEHGEGLARFLGERVEVVEGDVSKPGLGLDEATRDRLRPKLDVVINSSGLTDFNPDLRDALAVNVEATIHLLEFLRTCDHAALLHLSTCYVAGYVDGRVREELTPNYTPKRLAGFDAERERLALHELVKQTDQRAASPEVTAELQKEITERRSAELSGEALDNQLRKARIRWVRSALIEAGMRRAQELSWPNTYTLTKSLAESLIATRGSDLPVAVARPSIVETSTHDPFSGWNEGINTSASLSYLLGTYFRQLPSNERKRLDIVPVDLVCRGMTLIAAALVERRHERVYQLASSENNPCDMRRSIELTGLAHRKHYRAQEGLEHWLRLRFDTIAVSKTRYQRLSAPGQKAIVRSIRLLASPIPFMEQKLVKRERALDRVTRLIELYEPFILHNEQVFEAGNIELLAAALEPEERAQFGYDARAIDWWEYWINVHIPALRKWSYPLIEGRLPESRSGRTFRMAPAGNQTVPTGATWPSS
ncbi:MAG TPA: SDR family oxidoreductase [Terriglobales bacterium]|nr:SDR family oxidoreductase [Terriglobales bacterium]